MGVVDIGVGFRDAGSMLKAYGVHGRFMLCSA